MTMTENRNVYCFSTPQPVRGAVLAGLMVGCGKAFTQWFALSVLALTLFGPVPATAQSTLPEPSAPDRKSEEFSESAERLTDPPKANEHVIFVDENGEVVRVTAGGQIGEYLKWREQLLKGKEDNQPGYYVAAITLAGEVNAGRTVAILDASIEVFVRAGIDQVEVPLRLNEAILLKHRHTDPVPVEFLPTDRGVGMKCLITEPGQHRIDLQLSVPVRKSGNSHRLQLSLPGTAQSSLRLTVPGDVLALRPDQLADVEVRALPNAQSELIVHGLGAALDLPWQVLNTQPEEKTELQVETLMAADAGADGLAIEAVQTITSTRGSFDSVRIDVPLGFNVLSVSSSTHETFQTTSFQNNPVVVSLPESTTGPVRLTWLLSSSKETDSDQFSISGFNVENSLRQETLFGISVAEGFRLSPTMPRPQQVQRIRTSSFRKKVEAQFDPQIDFQQAYRLPARNSRVQFQLERIEASYRVSPVYDLLFRDASADLTAKFEVIVYRGSLDHVRLHWPDLKSQDWHQIEVVSPAEQVHIAGLVPEAKGIPASTRATADPVDKQNEITLQFVEPLNRTHGAVVIEIQARRPVPIGEEAFLISVPVADSGSVPVSSLTLRNAVNVESTIAPAGNTDLRTITEGLIGGRSARNGEPLNLLSRTYESTSHELTMLATVTTHLQEVTSSSRAVLNVTEDRITVEQQLNYNVSYAELDRLRILVPGPVLPEGFRLVSGDTESSVPLSAEIGGIEIDGVRQIRVNLPEPLLGQFDVFCNYSLPVDSTLATSENIQVEVPLLQPPEAQSESTRVEIRSPGNVGVLPQGPQWTQELTLSNAPSWITTGTARSVNLKLEAEPERATQNFIVRRAALQTRFQNGVAIRTSGVYLIDGDISFLTVTLPPKADRSSLSVWWDGELLEANSVVYASETLSPGDRSKPVAVREESDVRILVDGLPDRDQHMLALQFDTDRGGGFAGVNNLQMSAPRFASDVWLADTMWEVVLPINQHLLVYPENYTPAFSWQRQAVSWTRRPVDQNLSLHNWLMADSETVSLPWLGSQLETLGFDPQGGVPYGNSYLFSAFGHQHEVRFQTMSQPAIILAGAGLTLAIGLVLLRIPATRHVLTILVVGFGLSLAGLWHLEAVQLLLQPALFGLILAIVASVIESRVKRRQRASLVTFSSPSDFMVQGSSREEIIHDEAHELSERPA